ncbi:phenylalanine-4-hydroxylase [Herbaspirillum hiltneri N3]|uniref:Phenylalanine-4-hydroxylase n=1 Tax=Herbaspirillum hiltneri N3 TaxID=1262470 RepID=A0ABM5UWV1_9BURK|nr:phenylalanine 4-monooxygenase [Herbaspirillum hiltneri]AKZ61771.1 phenylalanine-4-hydroxylase [Herbaspirillum hiltneri N3]
MNNSVSTDDFFASVAAKSDSGALRGDYSNADKNYVVDQHWAAYSPAQHALWRRLYERQAKLIPGRACDVFLDSIKALDVSQGIPQFDRTTEALYKATGWQLVAVPGLVPDQTFFEHLANRRFPVTVWLREESEFDYIVEPDVFHDFFGHVPLLFNPVFADHLQEYGKGGLKALKLDGLAFLARLYWYTIEFGLIQSPEGLRIYGAGILSSGGEVEYALRGSPQNQQPNRIPFQVERVMRTLYKIDSYQETYFVIRDFQQLFDDTAPDFTALYEQLKAQDALPANTLLPGEKNLAVA